MGTVINCGKQALISILSLVIALSLLTPFTSRASFDDQTTAHLRFLKYLEGVADADAILPLFNFHLVGDNGFNGTFNHLGVAYLPVGNYTLTETGPAGYVLDKWDGTCNMAGQSNNGPSTQFVINQNDLGENFGCQIYNMVDPNGGGGGTTTIPTTGLLVVNKIVINDNGGNTATSSFSFKVNGGSNNLFSVLGTKTLTLPAGAYSVVENAAAGYTASYSAGCSGTISAGATSTCTITNNDIAQGGGGGNGNATGTLIVNKVVINDNGGTGTTSGFSFSVNGTASTTFEIDGSNKLTVATGTYAVLETTAAGYTASYSAGCSGTITGGATSTCTITNNDNTPGGGGGNATGTLMVNKIVINDNGGTGATSSFSFSVNGASSTLFEADGSNLITLATGAYTVVETASSTYATTYSGCTGIIALGTTSICTITNNDIASGTGNGTATGTLMVNKVVINDNGGTGTTSGFSFSVNGASSTAFEIDGTNELLQSTGAYTVLETAVSGYTASYSAGCSGTISEGATSTCTITNDDNAPGGGGSSGNSSSGGGGGGGGGSSRNSNNNNSNNSNNSNSNNSSPGEVLGATDDNNLPFGAPNTGMGGTSGNQAIPLAFALFGIGLALATLRRTQEYL